MEIDRGFNFRLLVPSRVNGGQVSAVRPQEPTEKRAYFMNTLQQGYGMHFDKEPKKVFASKSKTTPTKPTRQDFPKMKVVPPMEKDENNCNPGQLYANLFDEVEKIRVWKIKADSAIVQKERRLLENKRTIESQRKALQELQLGNETLTIKLEEQMSENEDMRNKNNATRNLCNILKDTFHRSAEKMQLFESEREETSQLFMENSESIQKLIAAFESLYIRVETDLQEMQKVKEGMLQFEEMKENFCQEYNLKEEEVAGLQRKLMSKENELQKILLDFHENQKQCKQLQEETKQQYELLKSSETEQESLLQKLHTVEQHNEEAQKSHKSCAAILEKSKVLEKELEHSLALEIQRAREHEDELMAHNEELERSSSLLHEATEQSAKKDEHIKILEDKLDIKSKSIEALEGKIEVTGVRVEELTAGLLRKMEEVQLFKNEAEMAFAENDNLKKACEAAEKAHMDSNEMSTVNEIKVQELQGQLLTENKKNKEHIEQLREENMMHRLQYEELLSNFNELQSEKMAIQQQFNIESSNVKDIEASEEKAVKLTKEIQRLVEENRGLRVELDCVRTNIHGQWQETETLQKKIEENCEDLQGSITEKEKRIKTVETKLCSLRKRIAIRFKAQEEYLKENKLLKKQMEKEIVKSSKLENVILSLQEESQNLKRLDQVHQKLLKDLEYKSSFAAELENEVQKLGTTVAEAVKNKEAVELKCQHKIADMVALMEKHKSQYDRMVDEKDAELDSSKKKEAQAVVNKDSLELELVKHKTENDLLMKQLETETAKKENLQKEVTDMKKKMTSIKITQLSEARNKPSPSSIYKQGRCLKPPKESVSKRQVYTFSETRITPSHSKDSGNSAVTNNKVTDNGNRKPPGSMTYRVGGASKIRSYRIRTPPSEEKAVCWGRSTMEFDPKSDSSDQNDLLTFANASAAIFSAPPCKLNTIKKIQSPISHKSPGSLLKLAAIKRMRDAGWTAVTGCDKKKKKNEKIFA